MFNERNEMKTIQNAICDAIQNELHEFNVSRHDVRGDNKLFVDIYDEPVWYVISYPEIIYWVASGRLYIKCDTLGEEYDYKINYHIENPNNDITKLVKTAAQQIRSLGKVPFTTKSEWWKHDTRYRYPRHSWDE